MKGLLKKKKKTRIIRKIELDSNAISSDNCLKTAVILWSVWHPIEQKEDRRFCFSLFIRLSYDVIDDEDRRMDLNNQATSGNT